MLNKIMSGIEHLKENCDCVWLNYNENIFTIKYHFENETNFNAVAQNLMSKDYRVQFF